MQVHCGLLGQYLAIIVIEGKRIVMRNCKVLKGRQS
jgi:hypothetical protein